MLKKVYYMYMLSISGIYSESLDIKIYNDPTPTYMYLRLVEHIWKANLYY